MMYTNRMNVFYPFMMLSQNIERLIRKLNSVAEWISSGTGTRGTWIDTRAGKVRLNVAEECLTMPDIVGCTRTRIDLKPFTSYANVCVS